MNGTAIANFVRADRTDDALRDLWELEGIGISSDGAGIQNHKEQDNQTVLDHFERTLQRLPDGRYQVRWPWREPGYSSLPTNEGLARARLTACERSLAKNGRLSQYDDAVQDYLDQEHAEIAPTVPDGPVHFLPHHAVYKRNKVRVVFDATAGAPSSLNDNIRAGPNLIADMTCLLLRFRFKRIGLVADLEKAFLQISLHPEDRDVTRFLWKSDATVASPTTYRMTRVVFGVNASPFLLQATIRHHLSIHAQTDSELVALLQRDIYCDDLITSVDTEEEAKNVSKRTKEIFQDAKMTMTQWSQSSSANTTPRPLCEPVGAKRKVLGISWVPAKDVLELDTELLVRSAREAPETKRAILRTAAQFYDPIGLMTPFSVRVNMILRVLWKVGFGIDWDEPITADVKSQWRKWLTELEQIGKIEVPQTYGLRTGSRYQLHAFCDASKEAFAAVIYLRTDNEDSVQGTALVICKARLAPTKQVSIPRLELTAAVIGARLMKFVKQHLPVTPTAEFFWTDSLVTLHWIRSDARRWGVYVQNRVKEIQALTSPLSWNHCDGTENPADLPSRGTPASFLQRRLWRHGPD